MATIRVWRKLSKYVIYFYICKTSILSRCCVTQTSARLDSPEYSQVSAKFRLAYHFGTSHLGTSVDNHTSVVRDIINYYTIIYMNPNNIPIDGVWRASRSILQTYRNVRFDMLLDTLRSNEVVVDQLPRLIYASHSVRLLPNGLSPTLREDALDSRSGH